MININYQSVIVDNNGNYHHSINISAPKKMSGNFTYKFYNPNVCSVNAILDTSSNHSSDNEFFQPASIK
ncbi:hypothetical protein GUI12_01695 [Anaplasmataceae bacterium AB001_6]|nr:hypothetical protein GUI12_01695 [Anaplasmataceae bacterium AB001_6]